MKKFGMKSLGVFLALVVLLTQTHVVSAKTIETGYINLNESDLTLDLHQLDLVMNDLNQLDNYLNQHNELTFQDLQDAGSELISNVSDSPSPSGMGSNGELPLGISGFWWGCILGVVGMLIVYLVTDNDKVQVKKSLYGCLIGSLFGLGIYTIAWR